MDPLDLDGWYDFAVASAGAAGALTGLIMVAMSVNIKEIIAGSALPARSGATIGSVAVILVSSVVILIPGQAPLALGLQLVLFALAALGLQAISVRRMFSSTGDGASQTAKYGESILGIGQLLPILIGGIVVACGSSAGLYGVATGFVLIFVVSILNAWVLMVEILR